MNRSALVLLLIVSLAAISGCISEGLGITPTLNTTLPATEPPTSTTAPTSGTLKVHFIDVGQGDAILLQLNEINILVDGGNQDGTVADYLADIGVTDLDIVVSTHPHADHIGGLVNVLEECTVGEVIDAGVVHTSQTFEDYLNLIDEKGITYTVGRAGDSRDFGYGLSMEVLHPVSPTDSDLNNASVVMRFTYGDVSFLLMGDAELESETEILASGANVDSTILKVGHHGSSTATSEAFLAAVSPDVAIIMCGEENSYGHPHEVTLEKLSTFGVTVYRTDINGTIIVTTTGNGYAITVEKNS